MKKYTIEIKWAVLFFVIQLAWMVFEKLMGWHGEHIEKHALYTNIFAVPAIIIYVFALRDKRNNYYNGKMNWLQGFITGIIISGIVALLSPLSQYIFHHLISPGYFTHIINYSVEQGKMSRVDALEYFSFDNYIVQSIIGALLMGMLTSAVVAVFVRRK